MHVGHRECEDVDCFVSKTVSALAHVYTLSEVKYCVYDWSSYYYSCSLVEQFDFYIP